MDYGKIRHCSYPHAERTSYRDLDPNYLESFVESELRWELADRLCPHIRRALNESGLQEVQLLLEHVTVHKGGVTIGLHGLIIPNIPKL